MTTAAVSMVRNEADVVEGMVRHTLGEVDHMIVADNVSTDGTRDILDRLADELDLLVVDDPEPGYYQSKKMSRLAEMAVETFGADWIVPADADELWYSPHGRISDVLDHADADVAHAGMYNHWATAVDPSGDDPFATMVWRDPFRGRLPKVAFRWRPGAVIGQGNHAVSLFDGFARRNNLLVEIRHFPYRTATQFVAKAVQGAAAYAAAPELPDDMGAHWRIYGEVVERHGPEALADHYRRHFWHLCPHDAGLVRDPAPYRRWEIS